MTFLKRDAFRTSRYLTRIGSFAPLSQPAGKSECRNVFTETDEGSVE